LLEPEKKYEKTPEQVIESRENLEKMNKTAQDAATDCLRLPWAYAQEHIRKHIPKDDDDNQSPKVVITVPAMWSDVAKERTRQAVQDAGIPGDISLVSEPEAAALAEFKDRARKGEPLKVRIYFYQCEFYESLGRKTMYTLFVMPAEGRWYVF
jgi:molecular chaperone DnaK (HSP70)